MQSDDLLKVVCLHDIAIDPSCALNLYGVTRDLEHLRFRKGMQPTFFYVRRIPRSIFLRTVDQGANDKDKWLRAFVFGVERVESAEHPEPITPSKEIDTPGGKLRVWDDQDLAMIPSPDDIYDIGSVAYGRGFLARGRWPYYQPPHTFPDAMKRKVFQDADVTRVGSKKRIGKPASPDSETKQTQQDDSGGKDKGATAKDPSNPAETSG